MAREFPLAGLLRLRRLQEDTAASELAGANRRVKDGRVVQSRARHALEGFTEQPTDVTTLRAIASARASTSAMLGELTAAVELHEADAEAAASVFYDARAKTVSLEKLDARHTVIAAAEDLRAEQIVIDEIASGSRSGTRKRAGQ